MKATFKNSVDVLVKAYLNDTLQHMNCYACACGNLVAAANDYVYKEHSGAPNIFTKEKFLIAYTPEGKVGSLGWAEKRMDKSVENTGYSFKELSKIERAFEGAKIIGCSSDTNMFNGLMAVVDALAEIHEIDLKAKEEAKSLFVKECV